MWKHFFTAKYYSTIWTCHSLSFIQWISVVAPFRLLWKMPWSLWVCTNACINFEALPNCFKVFYNSFVDYDFSIVLNTFCLIQCHKGFLLYLLKVLTLRCWSTVHFGYFLYLMWSRQGYPVTSALCLHSTALVNLSKFNSSYMWAQLYANDLFAYHYTTIILFYYFSFVVSLEIEKYESSNFILFQGC